MGILKEELRILDSLILKTADETSVPAGSALAVDRTLFSEQITKVLKEHPNVRVTEKEVTEIPDGPVIIATGPLTSDAFANLEQVDGDLILSDNWLNGWVCSNYNDWKKLSVVKGNIVFTDQADINDLGCFAHLTEVGGDITISGNGWNQGYIPLVSTDVQTGFDLIKRLKDNGVFKKPGAVFTLSRSPEEGNINVDDL